MVRLDDPRARAAYQEPEQEPEHEEELTRMSFGDHLDELRRRLIKSILAVVACVFGMLFFKEEVQRIIIEPYRILWRQGFREYLAGLQERAAQGALHPLQRDMLAFCSEWETSILDGTFPEEIVQILPERTGFKLPYELVAVSGVEDFWMFMMASFVFALVIASPIVLWQAWAFIGAGLYKRERQVFYRFFPFMLVLFTTGVLFGYYLALPFGLYYLIRLMVDGLVSSMLTVGNYFTFLFTVTAAMGLIFQLPLVMVALQRVGLVRHRTFVRKWRIVVLLIFVAAALLTPPDPFSMAFMAAPTLLLYGLGLLLTRRGRHREAAGLDAPAPAGSSG